MERKSIQEFIRLETIMKRTAKYVAPWLAAAAIGGAIGLSPVAFANPVYGPVPQAPAPTPVPAPAPAPAPSNVGASPLVPDNVILPNPPITVDDPYLKDPAGGVDLPS